MISRKAVSSFLKKKRDSYTWMKNLTKEEIQEAINSLDGFNGFKTEPFFHQYVSFYIGACIPEFLFLLDMGLGKTKVILDLLTYLIELELRDRSPNKSLILVADDLNVQNWINETEIHSDLKIVPVLGPREEKKDLLNSTGDLFVMSYYGLRTVFTRRDPTPGKTRWIPDERKATVSLMSLFDFIGFDEIQKSKNKESLTYKLCNRLAKQCKFRYGMTGTPFGRDPSDFWAEYYLIDRGYSLGETLGMMRQAYFEEVKTYWAKEYKLENHRPFRRALQHRSIEFEDDECNDIPKSKLIPVYLPMPPDMREYYSGLVEGLISAEGNYFEIDNIFARMRSLLSGHLKLIDEDEEERIIYIDNPPKIEWLKQFLLDLPEHEKVIVVYEYTRTGELIDSMLKELKIKNSWLKGGLKNPIECFNNFKDNVENRVLNMNWRCGNTGLNLQFCRYMVLVETPVSPIERKQLLKRINRTGQRKRCYFYDLLIKYSKDEDIMEFLQEGVDLFQSLVRGSNK